MKQEREQMPRANDSYGFMTDTAKNAPSKQNISQV